VCPECEEEYRPDIALCADCGTELVDADEDGTPLGAKEAVPVEAGVPARALYSGTPAGLRLLADALVADEVPFQLVPEERTGRSDGARLILVVPETECERAIETLASFRGRGTELGFAELAARWGDGDEAAEAPCPACGVEVPAEASACPDCGLELGGAPE
jgi:hypothetical protein